MMDELHHIVGLAVDPHRAFAHDNVAPLCTRCHARVETMERDGQSTAKLFKGVGGGEFLEQKNTETDVFVF